MLPAWLFDWNAGLFIALTIAPMLFSLGLVITTGEGQPRSMLLMTRLPVPPTLHATGELRQVLSSMLQPDSHAMA